VAASCLSADDLSVVELGCSHGLADLGLIANACGSTRAQIHVSMPRQILARGLHRRQ
jgi:hypothetical protein